MKTTPAPRVLLAPNSFKGTLTAAQACRALARGVLRTWPSAQLTSLPLSDGGDGFLATLTGAGRGRITRRLVPGPLGQPVRSPIGWLEQDGHTIAVIEMATCCGLSQVGRPDPATAGAATTRGLGAAIRLALRAGADQILVGLGGSASTDGGAGLASELGYRLLGRDGAPVPPGGLGLLQLDRIDSSGRDPRLAGTELLAACDVSNPLLGPLGAAAVYGPQKGADQEMVGLLEQGLGQLRKVAARDLGRTDASREPGAGAAGGTGFGLLAFCEARLVPGSELVAQACGLDRQISAADLVITGEGHFDLQSLSGKAPGEVARRCRRQGIPCVVVAGEGDREAGARLQEMGGLLVETHTDLGPPGHLGRQARAGLAARVRSDLARAASVACELALPAGVPSGPPQ